MRRNDEHDGGQIRGLKANLWSCASYTRWSPTLECMDSIKQVEGRNELKSISTETIIGHLFAQDIRMTSR